MSTMLEPQQAQHETGEDVVHILWMNGGPDNVIAWRRKGSELSTGYEKVRAVLTLHGAGLGQLLNLLDEPQVRQLTGDDLDS